VVGLDVANGGVDGVDHVQQPDRARRIGEANDAHPAADRIQILQLKIGRGLTRLQLAPDHRELFAQFKGLARPLLSHSALLGIRHGSRRLQRSVITATWDKESKVPRKLSERTVQAKNHIVI
jgi:hypothetical protein